MSEATYIRWAADRLNVPDPVVKKARGGDNSTVYEIASVEARWFLKIGDHLERECARLRWLQGRLPIPQVVALDTAAERDALLMSAVAGTDLAALAKRLRPDSVVEMLASALRTFHSANASDCPFTAYIPGKTLVHGDACLPNILCGDDGRLNGYVDLGDMGAGDVEVDLSAAVWSLQYNLGPGLGLRFLRAYGLPEATERDVDRLRNMYAAGHTGHLFPDVGKARHTRAKPS
jgi:aminoglycoside phosphotransferase